MVYKVTVNLNVDVHDEDYTFERNCRDIKLDIEQELYSCWHSVDVTRIHFEAPPDHEGGFIKIPKMEYIAEDDELFS